MKVSFWLFVATLFLLYGLIIMGTGIYYWVYGSDGPNTMYHVSVWWGLVMCAMSLVFFRANQS